MNNPYPYADLSSPQRRRVAVQNITTMHDLASPETRAAGRDWYETVHEATAKGVKGTGSSVRQGAGMVAAVSPSMDWDNRNINALGEIHSLRRADWDKVIRGDRSPLAGMSIDSAGHNNLVKAHRLLEGEDVDEVLNRRTAPKTNSFAHNIAEPDVSGHVTIDGRAHDIATNRLVPWEHNRGIGSAALKSGKPTRYEHFEQSYRQAADALTRMHGTPVLPHQVQAIDWVNAKALERQGTTKKGTPRKVGVRRIGQPYLGDDGLQPRP